MKYSEEMAAILCERLSLGESLRTICESKGMPDRASIMRWQDDNEQFAAKCARARVLQADFMDDLILDTAKACTSETAAADRVKIGAYQWRAARLQPKKYGDRSVQEIVGKDGGPIETRDVSDELRIKAIKALLAKKSGSS